MVPSIYIALKRYISYAIFSTGGGRKDVLPTSLSNCVTKLILEDKDGESGDGAIFSLTLPFKLTSTAASSLDWHPRPNIRVISIL